MLERRNLSVLVLTLSMLVPAWLAPAARAQDAQVTIKPIGVRVVAPSHEDDDDLRAFSQFEGTTVSLLILAPKGGLLGVDANESELATFVDDKGTDLAVKRKFSNPGFGGWPRINEKGTAAVIDVSGGGIPKPGAAKLIIKGTLLVQTATKDKTVDAANVKLAKGTKLEMGEMTWTIEKVGKPQWGDDPLMVEFKTDKKLDALKAVRFLDAAGNEIESSEASSSSMSFGNMVSASKSFTLKKKVDSVTVQAVWWTDMKASKVKVDVEAGLGL